MVTELGFRHEREEERDPSHTTTILSSFYLIYEVVLQVQQGARNVSWLVTHSVSLPDLIRPSPLYRTSLYSLFCVSVRTVGPSELDLIALPHASAGGREILDLSLHSPTLGAGGRETLLFSFQICP